MLGDFNRAFDVHGPGDHVWREIDDGSPAGLDLWRLPFQQESDRWRGTGRHHPRPIDFLVFDDQDGARGTPSDHCPITVDLRLE